MANSLTPLSPTFWSRIMGRKKYKTEVFRSFASFEEQKTLSYGLTVDRPYRADLVVENYVKGTAASAQDLSASSNTLTINKQKTILMYVDDVDKIQNKWDIAKASAEEAGRRLGIAVDAEVLYEVRNAADTIDDGDIGGSAGSPITPTVSNIVNIASKTHRKLDVNNLGRENRFWVISPQLLDVIVQYLAGKESLLGDKTTDNGHAGRFLGFELYLSNNLTASARWTPANQPSDGDTITIGGVVFTFETGTLDAAGKVKSETSTAVTLDNLVAFINAGGDASVIAQGYTLSVADQRIVQNMVAVDGTTYVDVYQKGVSYITVSGSEPADTWTLKQQHSLAGVKGAIDVVIQKEPEMGPESMASTVSAGKRGMNIMPLEVFGVKTFDQGTREILDVQLAITTA